MENIPLPKIIEYKNIKENKTQVKIEPLFPGYGITIANPLRRVLISSLIGAAITKIKIKDINHEFSTLPGIKEDMVEIILNIKKIRMKMFSDEPIKLKLKVKGETEIKAGDIEKNAQVEIANPDLIIAHMTDKKAEFEMELTVEKGMGYISVEDREDKNSAEPGEILVDALFSPIVNVSFTVEEVRVGKITDYEKVEMKIETDGTITPKEALKKSVKLIIDHFKFIESDGLDGEVVEELAQEEVIEEKEKKVKKTKTTKETKEKKTTKKAKK